MPNSTGSPSSLTAARRVRTGKILLLAAAGLSMTASIGLWFSGRVDEGLFVGLWVPSILSFGSLVYAGRPRSRP